MSKSPSIPVATVAKGKVKKPSSARPPVTVEPASKAETKEIPQLLEYFDEVNIQYTSKTQTSYPNIDSCSPNYLLFVG